MEVVSTHKINMENQKMTPFRQYCGDDPPCEKHACDNFTFCATEKKACSAFAIYVNTGRSLLPGYPTKSTYNLIYRDTDD